MLGEHLFLPGNNDFDLAPHRVDTAVRKIREYEQQQGWKQKRIILVGDNEQKSNFVTASSGGVLKARSEEVSLRTIAAAYQNVIVLDPTEIALKQILFRASDKEAEKYTEDFYHRLSLLGYEPTNDQSIIVGYDITDLETEHQLIPQKQSGYLPVIFSRDVFDELVKSRLKDNPLHICTTPGKTGIGRTGCRAIKHLRSFIAEEGSGAVAL